MKESKLLNALENNIGIQSMYFSKCEKYDVELFINKQYLLNSEV